jgi:acetoin utilization protein AcuB
VQFTTLIRIQSQNNSKIVIAENLITESIPTVTLDEIGSKVLTLMEIFRVSHLPVVVGKEYFGVVSDKDIYDAENFNEKIEKYITPNLLQPHVHSNQHIFEVFGVALGCGVSIVPVLEEDHSYLGSISRTDLAFKMTELLSSNEPGGIIVLELTDISYSLTQIAQIIEGNDARILSLYIHKPSPSSKELDVTIKVNVEDLSGIIQTFARYDYVIKSTYMDQSQIKNLFDDRYDQFMRYLNV